MHWVLTGPKTVTEIEMQRATEQEEDRVLLNKTKHHRNVDHAATKSCIASVSKRKQVFHTLAKNQNDVCRIFSARTRPMYTKSMSECSRIVNNLFER